MSKGLIQLTAITKTFQTGEVLTNVLNGIDLTIQEGEFVAIMGHSGAGKSTLMNILSFLDRPTSGQYFFEDTATETFSDDVLAEIRNSKVGFVFQTFNLLANVSAMDNVKLPLIYAGVSEREQNSRAKQALEEVGLAHRIEYTPGQLSGGEQQRVAIARALINNPKIIFADEPTGNLDSKASAEIIKILRDLHKKMGHTIIMVTHEDDTAANAERIIKLKDGLIIDDKKITPIPLEANGNVKRKNNS